MKKLLLMLILLVSLGGCQMAAYTQGDHTGQGLNSEFTQSATTGYAIIERADGSVEVVPLPPAPEAPSNAKK
jgi:hypothetical protein